MGVFIVLKLLHNLIRRSYTKIRLSIIQFQEEWLSRRKRFASRRYSERNVDSMPPPSPYQPMMNNHGQAGLGGHDQPDARVPTLDHRPPNSSSARNRRTRKKDCVFVIYWNLLRWLFWVRIRG